MIGEVQSRFVVRGYEGAKERTFRTCDFRFDFIGAVAIALRVQIGDASRAID